MKTKWQVEDGGESILYFLTGAIKPEWSFQKQERYFQLLKKKISSLGGGWWGCGILVHYRTDVYNLRKLKFVNLAVHTIQHLYKSVIRI